MEKYVLVLIIAVGFLVGCAREHSLEDLESSIQERVLPLDGTFAVAFKNLDDTSQVILTNEREMFHAASTVKTPVMIELFRQAGQGRFSLNDSILVKNEFRSILDSSRYQMDISENSEGELYEMIGEKRTIRDMIDDMITMSSNLATNILIEKVGAHNVTETIRSYGADSILMLRGVEDIKAYERGLSNRTTAYDEMLIYEKLARGEAAGPGTSDEMINILKQQHFNEMIPAQLPDEVEVAHKTGWITGVNHDAGIVLLPDGRRYVLVLLSKNADDREAVLEAFADISRMVYNFVVMGGRKY